MGSSPLTRGTLLHLGSCCLAVGLIPAYAGNTARYHITAAVGRAHPRLRGEHAAGADDGRPLGGSSPLTRGTQATQTMADCQCGLIPAYAGNTVCVGESCTSAGAHPRLRGEHPALARGAGFASGSSPLTRGTPVSSSLLVPGQGLIPAYAGNTPSHSGPRALTWAHPRLRGEHPMPTSRP